MGALATTLGVVGGVAGAVVVGGSLYGWLEVERLEKPKYTVLKTIQGRAGRWSKVIVEVRQYAPYVIAEALCQGKDMRQATSNGFRQVAGYIFGGNVGKAGGSEKIAMTSPVRSEVAAEGASESIAMTSPVRTEAAGPETYKISFVMPSKYTLDSLPTPKNDNVKFREVPGQIVAALGFSGNIPNSATVDARRDELLSLLRQEGLVPEGDVLLYQYHPPFMPGFMRRNEVLFRLKDYSQE